MDSVQLTRNNFLNSQNITGLTAKAAHEMSDDSIVQASILWIGSCSQLIGAYALDSSWPAHKRINRQETYPVMNESIY